MKAIIKIKSITDPPTAEAQARTLAPAWGINSPRYPPEKSIQGKLNSEVEKSSIELKKMK